ncbi:MAG: hypothetical protein ACREDK_06750 [Thermoplasmata archaeon]
MDDKHQTLLQAHADAEAEASRLAREEEYVIAQIHQAKEQVRHYEGLLTLLRRDWGARTRPLVDLVRKL